MTCCSNANFLLSFRLLADKLTCLVFIGSRTESMKSASESCNIGSWNIIDTTLFPHRLVKVPNKETGTRGCWSPCHQYVSRGGDWSVTATRRQVQSPLKALAPACIMTDTSTSLCLPFYIQVPVEMESALANWTDFNRKCHCGKNTPICTANF